MRMREVACGWGQRDGGLQREKHLRSLFLSPMKCLKIISFLNTSNPSCSSAAQGYGIIHMFSSLAMIQRCHNAYRRL